MLTHTRFTFHVDGMRHALRAASSVTSAKSLRLDNVNRHLREMEYAVRGTLVIKADEYAKDLANGKKLPFTEIVQCNIGNPQALGQAPLTFFRQVLSLCINPSLLEHPEVAKLFPNDAIARAGLIMKNVRSMGAYTHSQGFPHVRKNVANFIEKRDSFSANPDHIFLTDGASPGVQSVIKTLIRSEKDAILVPTPQYPLYSATITAAGGTRVDYYLDEENSWDMSLPDLERAYEQAKKRGLDIRALVAINPGNPTGQCLDVNAMQQVVDFCRSKKLVLLADEVYQTNVYNPYRPFVSFKKVLRGMGAAYNDVELFSFHSVSKGVLGECGLRGGYMELTNIDQPVVDQFYKNASVNLCSNTTGQITVDLMVAPPQPGETSYDLYRQEYDAIYASLARRARALVEGLNRMEGVKCNPAEGAMYAFPQITIPKRAVEAAEKIGQSPDTFYCLKMLESTGVCVVPGSGFGQRDGTYHFRTTFLPSENKISGVIRRLAEFHAKFMKEYK